MIILLRIVYFRFNIIGPYGIFVLLLKNDTVSVLIFSFPFPCCVLVCWLKYIHLFGLFFLPFLFLLVVVVVCVSSKMLQILLLTVLISFSFLFSCGTCFNESMLTLMLANLLPSNFLDTYCLSMLSLEWKIWFIAINVLFIDLFVRLIHLSILWLILSILQKNNPSVYFFDDITAMEMTFEKQPHFSEVVPSYFSFISDYNQKYHFYS